MNCRKMHALKYSFGIFVAAGLIGTIYAGISETADFSAYPDKILTGQFGWGASGTPESRLEWKTEGGKSYTSTSAETKLFYPTPMPKSETYSTEIKFRMNIVQNLSSGVADVMRIGISNRENKHGDDTYIALRRDKDTQCRLIYAVRQSDLPGAAGTLGKFSLSAIDPDNDGATDDLILKLTLTRGKTEKDWKLSGSIRNATTDVVIGDDSVNFVSNNAFFSGNLVAYMGIGHGDEAGGVSNRTVSVFQINTIP